MTTLTNFTIRKILFIVFLLQAGPGSSYAVLVTHEWQQSHHGYSIELIPGTGGTTGTAAEYVAAGTVFDINRPNEAAWHFMRLDDNGNILASRIAWSQGMDQQFRVVDIAAQSPNEFRITIQARITFLPFARYYIYIHGVDLNGMDLPNNPDITIWSGESELGYSNIYPTHSYYGANGLFICGYATKDTEFPNTPDNSYTDKIGVILKVDVNANPVTVNSYFWNTGGAMNTDYDMPLRLVPGSFANEFPLLMTGAMNISEPGGAQSFTGKSAALVAKIDASGFMSTANGVAFNNNGVEPEGVGGIYGVDIRSSIGGGLNYALLVNFFSEETFRKTWGVIRLDAFMGSYGPSTNSVVYMSQQNSWANQFLNLHNDGQGYGDHIPIVGQQIERYPQPCDPLPSGTKAPGFANVNPFVGEVRCGNAWWSYPAGFNTGLGTLIHRYTYLSATGMGTRGANMDYLSGNFGDGPALEDVSRLYTFSSVSHFYDDPVVPQPIPYPAVYPAMVVPVGEDPNFVVNNMNLLTKFLGLAHNYQEQSCEKEVNDCMHLFRRLGTSRNTGEFTSSAHQSTNYQPGYALFSLDNQMYIPNHLDCTTGYYKPAGIKSTKEGSGQISIFPNPTTSHLNILLSSQLNADDVFSFTLSDMTGKEVYHSADSQAGNTNVQIDLPMMASGVYVGTVHLNGTKHTSRIVIK